MSKPIAAGDLFQGGRINAYDPAVGLSFLRYSDILDPADGGLEFNFPNAQAQGNTFGAVRSIFVDNSDNDYEVRVTVAGTRQTFPISANSTGYYLVDSQLGSTILVETAGVSADVVEIIFYNYPQQPYVWFKYGNAVTANVTIGNGDDVALGSTTDPAITNPATNGTLIAFTRGILTGINAAAASLVTVVADFVSLLTDTANIVTNTSDTATNTADIVINTGTYFYENLTGSATTTVKPAAGTLGRVVVNTAAGGAGSIIVYDNTAGSGAIIATIDAQQPGNYEYNVPFAIGLTLVTSGGPDVTVIYR